MQSMRHPPKWELPLSCYQTHSGVPPPSKPAGGELEQVAYSSPQTCAQLKLLPLLVLQDLLALGQR